MKISEIAVDDVVCMDLLVKASEIKLTKARKKYLHIELTDGIDSIHANIWDWNQDSKPPKNSILTIIGTMGEYNGTKQLNVSSFAPSIEGKLEDFLPNGNVDIDEYMNEAARLAGEIEHIELQKLVHDVWNKYQHRWRKAPGAKSVHHAYLAGNLEHCVDVAHKARAMAKLIPEANTDLCVAGALLHDLGKLWTYDFEECVIEFTEEGQLLDHISIGMEKLEQFRTFDNEGCIDLLKHIIASHHGKLEYGSPVTPRCIEAWIVNYCDGIDVTAQVIKDLNRKAAKDASFTERAYTLENRPMLTSNRVAELLNSTGRV